MKQISSMCLAAFLLFAGCVGANDGNKNSSLLLSGVSNKSLLDIATNPQRSLANFSASIHYVDALGGDDSNPGTSLAPYKTITYAVSQPGNTIYVAPGIYNEELGERFPIRIPIGMNLIGNESGKGTENGPRSGYGGIGTIPNEGPTLIFGVGQLSPGIDNYATLTQNDNSIIAGFTITNPKSPSTSTTAGIKLGSSLSGIISGITIRNNTLTGTPKGAGIYIGFSNQGTGNIISGNTIISNYLGIYHDRSNVVFKVENNLISQNWAGIVLVANTNFNTNVDLGGGPTGSLGNNTISCNTQFDLSLPSVNTITLYAKNNQWDHIPPTVLTTYGVADILNYQNSSIFTSGMSLAAAHCNP
ncbi:PF07602 family protein [Leptospira santarosai str. CBC523]|nr:PF07602 family protein [Leptospira santarosai]EMO12112.1 PF07602 family protein [Leptospira santarosai str. CBC523]